MGTVLVTGGTGFIGRHTARSLADAGEQVVVTYRRSFRVPQLFSDVIGSRVKAVRCDALDLPEFYRVICDHGVESIVHFTHISLYEGTLYQAMQTNVLGTVNMMEAAAFGSVKKVTYISSGGATTGPEGYSVGAEDEIVPIASAAGNVVSPSKKAGEVLSLFYGATFGIPVIIVRPGGNSYGPYSESEMDHTKVLRGILEEVLKGKPVDLPHVGKDYQFHLTYVRDMAAGISLVHKAPRNQYRVYCITEEKPTSWGEIAEVIKELVPGSTIKFGRSTLPTRVQPLPEELRITSEFGFKPKFGLKEGLREYIEWYKNGQP